MTKAQLIARWHIGNYKQILANFDSIFNELNLTQLKNLADTFEDRIDCRGLSLLTQITDNTEIENVLENIDFSYAELGQTINFSCCQFDNCLFKNSLLDCSFWGSQMRDCQFIGGQINTNFGCAVERKLAEKSKIKAYYNDEQYGYESLTNCTFSKVTFKKYAGIGAICKQCVFDDCKFNFWILDGIFEDCQFIGILSNVMFSGYQLELTDYPPTETTPFNHMKNVDFSQCELSFMAFRNNCDLSQIIPPNPNTHLVVKHSLAFAQKVEELIAAHGFDSKVRQYRLFDLFKLAGISRADYLQKFPDHTEAVNNTQYFELHATTEPWGMIGAHDYLTTATDEAKQYTKDWFDICCEANRLTQ